MQKSYIPKVEEKDFCKKMILCTIRKNTDWIKKIWVKYLDWNIKEDDLNEVISKDFYKWKKIIRTYSSWHVFIDDEKKKTFLVTTEKNWKTQHQFTWWAPLEEENKNIISKDDWVYKINLQKVVNNARIRTKNRTWVLVLKEYNFEEPIIDWVLMENEENWEIYYKLVCLIHFIVKEYEWILSYTWNENSVDWKWYDIKNLLKIENIALRDCKKINSHFYNIFARILRQKIFSIFQYTKHFFSYLRTKIFTKIY